jgi:ribosomal protein S18 acetylase RimI-like enzyme
MSIEVRKPTKDELPQLAKGMATAFDDDSLSVWLFLNDITRLADQERVFSYILDLGMQIGHVHTTEGLEGASIWFPDDYEVGLFQVFGRSYARLKVLQTLAAKFESDLPNDNLNFISAFQTNQGVGTALITYHLAELDLSDRYATLDASSEASKRLYERLGFVTLGDVVIPNGPTSYAMLRPPSPNAIPLQ